MQHSPSRESNRFSASQEIPPILWNLKVHYRIHKGPPTVHTRSIQSTTTHSTSWRFILILLFHLCLSLQSGIFPSGFPTKSLSTPLLSPIRATCHAHLILLDFITRKILVEQNGSLSSSLCSFLSSTFLLAPLSPKYPPLHPIVKQSQPTFLPQCVRPSFTFIQSAGKFIFPYTLIFKIWIAKWKTKHSAPNDNKYSLILYKIWYFFYICRCSNRRLSAVCYRRQRRQRTPSASRE